MKREIQSSNEQVRKELYCRSEYLKTIGDFTRYIHKEYIEPSDRRALILIACDGTIGGSQEGISHMLLGNKVMQVEALASVMNDERMADTFRMARVMSARDGDLQEEIKHEKKDRRYLYFLSVMAALWTVGVVIFTLTGIFHWSMGIANMIFMAIVWLRIWSSISETNRRIRNLSKEAKDDALERLKMNMAKMFAFMDCASREVGDDDDDE